MIVNFTLSNLSGSQNTIFEVGTLALSQDCIHIILYSLLDTMETLFVTTLASD